MGPWPFARRGARPHAAHRPDGEGRRAKRSRPREARAAARGERRAAKIAGLQRWVNATRSEPIGADRITLVLMGSIKAPRFGDPAPDFELERPDGSLVRLGDLIREKALVLFFYPRD